MLLPDSVIELLHLTHTLLSQYEATVQENKADIQIATLYVTDRDEPHSPAWNTKFTIIDGDPGGLFSVKTGTNKHEGILSTAKVGREPRTLRRVEDYETCRWF